VLAALTEYETLLLVVALVFISFALVAALVIPRRRPDFPAKRLGIFIGVCIVLFFAQIGAVLLLAEVGEADEPVHEATPTETTPTETTPTETTPTETAPTETTPTETTEAAGDPVAGKAVFLTVAQPSCGGCHTLADAGSTGSVGPNLDAASPSFDKVVERVTEGQGVMPSFADSLTEQQIADVAAYVSSVAGS
jgi:mono/diheme cytochrome c family protein